MLMALLVNTACTRQISGFVLMLVLMLSVLSENQPYKATNDKPTLCTEIVQNSRDHGTCSQLLEATCAFKKLENCRSLKIWMMPIRYWCLCLQIVKLTWNKLYCSWEIVNRHLFSAARWEVVWEFLTEVFWFSLLSATSFATFASSRAKVEKSILFVKILNWYFERH